MRKNKFSFIRLGTPMYLLLCAMFLSFTLSSCSNDDDNMGEQTKSSFDPTRKVFATQAELDEFMASRESVEVSDEPSSYSPDDELSIIESYVNYTIMGSILNDKLEFQVGDDIYKLGESGYSTYVIKSSKYWEALDIIKGEESVILNLASYDKLDNGNYKLIFIFINSILNFL